MICKGGKVTYGATGRTYGKTGVDGLDEVRGEALLWVERLFRDEERVADVCSRVSAAAA